MAAGVPWRPSLGFSKCSPGLKLLNHRKSLKATFLVLHTVRHAAWASLVGSGRSTVAPGTESWSAVRLPGGNRWRFLPASASRSSEGRPPPSLLPGLCFGAGPPSEPGSSTGTQAWNHSQAFSVVYFPGERPLHPFPGSIDYPVSVLFRNACKCCAILE